MLLINPTNVPVAKLMVRLYPLAIPSVTAFIAVSKASWVISPRLTTTLNGASINVRIAPMVLSHAVSNTSSTSAPNDFRGPPIVSMIPVTTSTNASNKARTVHVIPSHPNLNTSRTPPMKSFNTPPISPSTSPIMPNRFNMASRILKAFVPKATANPAKGPSVKVAMIVAISFQRSWKKSLNLSSPTLTESSVIEKALFIPSQISFQ